MGVARRFRGWLMSRLVVRVRVVMLVWWLLALRLGVSRRGMPGSRLCPGGWRS